MRGFSLVEIIVTIAIMGILSALVVPQYDRIIFRVKESEAKVLMSSLYGAEKSFYAEYVTYQSTFGTIGFSPEGQLRYNIGFGETGAPQVGPANGFYTTPSVGDISTLVYCADVMGGVGYPGNTCRTIKGEAGVLPPHMPYNFMTTQTDFLIGAVIIVPSNFAQLNFSNRFNSFVSLILGEVYALGPPNPIGFIQTFSMSIDKKFSRITCPYDSTPVGIDADPLCAANVIVPAGAPTYSGGQPGALACQCP